MNARQKHGILLVFLGLSMVFTSLWLHKTHEKKDALAGENAQVLLSRLQTPAAPVIAPRQPSETLAVKEFQGYTMIGTLWIGDLSMELPVLSTWNQEWLELAPCRYSGSLEGKNLIIMGHNYKSHFTPLHNIALGTQVEFEDVNGIRHRFQVDKTEIVHENAVDRLASDYPLTLFTCTAGGRNRLLVRCAEATESAG